ncbi:MAG: 30S ribosomal protein S16 [Patescibacteria group bacterium]
MLKIRLQRVGRKHEPSFRLVVTDSKNSTKSGKFLEILGSYDPRFKKPVIDAESAKVWMSKGAKPSGTVHNLFIDAKILSGKKINVLPRKTPIKKEEVPVGAPATVKAEEHIRDTALSVSVAPAPSEKEKTEEKKTEEAAEAKAE